jgi:heme iron utilization protein
MMTKDISPFRHLTDDVRNEIRTLVRDARFGALATLNPQDGYPMASRILIATDGRGGLMTLISTLANHTAALLADRRCSLMIGEPKKGDPLASPRLMLTCDSRQIDQKTDEDGLLRERFAKIHPKSRLYLGFSDFSIFKFEIEYATYNGGFGRAFQLLKGDFQDHNNLLTIE